MSARRTTRSDPRAPLRELSGGRRRSGPKTRPSSHSRGSPLRLVAVASLPDRQSRHIQCGHLDAHPKARVGANLGGPRGTVNSKTSPRLAEVEGSTRVSARRLNGKGSDYSSRSRPQRSRGGVPKCCRATSTDMLVPDARRESRPAGGEPFHQDGLHWFRGAIGRNLPYDPHDGHRGSSRSAGGQRPTPSSPYAMTRSMAEHVWHSF